MILVLTASDDATADYLCERLILDQLEFVRLDTDRFSADGFVEFSSTGPVLHLGSLRLIPPAISSVWYRRPCGVPVLAPGDPAHLLHSAREWGAALDGFLAHVPAPRWINHPANNAHAGNKLLQLTTAARVGLKVPKTLVTRSPSALREFFDQCEGRVIVKPLSVGYVESPEGKLIAQIFTSRVHPHHLECGELLSRCPTLFQAEVVGAEDVRVTVLDGEYHALLQEPPVPRVGTDIRRYDVRDVSYRPVVLPAHVRTRLFDLIDALQLRFAALDFMVTPDKEWVFLEANPNGQWAWTDLLGVSNIARMFLDGLGGRRRSVAGPRENGSTA